MILAFFRTGSSVGVGKPDTSALFARPRGIPSRPPSAVGASAPTADPARAQPEPGAQDVRLRARDGGYPAVIASLERIARSHLWRHPSAALPVAFVLLVAAQVSEAAQPPVGLGTAGAYPGLGAATATRPGPSR